MFQGFPYFYFAQYWLTRKDSIGYEGFNGKNIPNKSGNSTKATGPLLGIGDDKFHKYMLEESIPRSVQNVVNNVLENGDDITSLSKPSNWSTPDKPFGISAKILANATKKAIPIVENNAAALYDNIYEWRYSEDDQDFKISNNWRHLSISRDERRAAANPILYANECRKEFLSKYRLDINNDQQPKINGHTKWSDKQILMSTINCGSIPYIFTDGGHISEKDHNEPASAAAMVICKPDIKDDETFESREWESRTMTTLLVRIMVLPNNLGAHNTDNGHAEILGLCMAEEALPINLPTMTFTDSLASLIIYRILREGSIGTQRNLIRNLMCTSKACITRLLINIAEWSYPAQRALEQQAYEQETTWEHTDPSELELDEILDKYLDENGDIIQDDNLEEYEYEYLDEEEQWNINKIPEPSKMEQHNGNIRKDLPELPSDIAPITQENMKNALEIIGSWVKGKYVPKYADNHNLRCVAKIDSHQSDNDDKKLKQYPTLVPNKAIVSGNQRADTAASIGIGNHKGARRHRSPDGTSF